MNHQLETLYYHPTERAAQKRALLNLPKKTAQSAIAAFQQSGGDAARRWNITTMAKYGLAGGASDAKSQKWFQDLLGQKQLVGYVNMPFIHTNQLINTPANRGVNEFAGTGGSIRNSVSIAGSQLAYPHVSEEMGKYGDAQVGLYPFNLELDPKDPLSIQFAHSLYQPESSFGIQSRINAKTDAHLDKLDSQHKEKVQGLQTIADVLLSTNIQRAKQDFQNTLAIRQGVGALRDTIQNASDRFVPATELPQRDPTRRPDRNGGGDGAGGGGPFGGRRDDDDGDDEGGGGNSGGRGGRILRRGANGRFTPGSGTIAQGQPRDGTEDNTGGRYGGGDFNNTQLREGPDGTLYRASAERLYDMDMRLGPSSQVATTNVNDNTVTPATGIQGGSVGNPYSTPGQITFWEKNSVKKHQSGENGFALKDTIAITSRMNDTNPGLMSSNLVNTSGHLKGNDKLTAQLNSGQKRPPRVEMNTPYHGNARPAIPVTSTNTSPPSEHWNGNLVATPVVRNLSGRHLHGAESMGAKSLIRELGRHSSARMRRGQTGATSDMEELRGYLRTPSTLGSNASMTPVKTATKRHLRFEDTTIKKGKRTHIHYADS